MQNCGNIILDTLFVLRVLYYANFFWILSVYYLKIFRVKYISFRKIEILILNTTKLMVGFLRVLISIGFHSSSKLTASQNHQFPNQSFMNRLLLNKFSR